MFSVIFAGLLLLVAIIIFTKGSITTTNRYGEKAAEYKIRYFAIIPFLIALLILAASSAYSQGPGEAIVIQSFTGKVVDVDETEGLGFTAPWNDKIPFDKRNQKITLDNQDSAFNDNSSAPFDIVVTYSLRGECAGEVFSKYQTQEKLEDSVLLPGTRSSLKTATAKFGPLDVLENRPQLSSNLLELLRTKFEDECVFIDEVDVVDIQLDTSIVQAVNARNAAKVEVEKAEQEYRKSEVNIRQQLNEKKAEADKVQIQQCGGTEVDVTENVDGVETTVTKVVPNGPENCQNLINTQTLALAQIEAMKSIGAGGNMVIVSPDGTLPMIQVPQTSPG